MAESTIIMSKQALKLDGSLKPKAFTFLEKLTTDDTAPGLHIEPVKKCRDSRVRTGRVDQQYRAVLFKLTGEDGNRRYVLEGFLTTTRLTTSPHALNSPSTLSTEFPRSSEPNRPSTPPTRPPAPLPRANRPPPCRRPPLQSSPPTEQTCCLSALTPTSSIPRSP